MLQIGTSPSNYTTSCIPMRMRMLLFMSAEAVPRNRPVPNMTPLMLKEDRDVISTSERGPTHTLSWRRDNF